MDQKIIAVVKKKEIALMKHNPLKPKLSEIAFVVKHKCISYYLVRNIQTFTSIGIICGVVDAFYSHRI